MAPRTQFILQDVTINTENVAGAWRHKVRAPDLLNLQGYLSRASPDGLQFGCNDFPIWRFWEAEQPRRASQERTKANEQAQNVCEQICGIFSNSTPRRHGSTCAASALFARVRLSPHCRRDRRVLALLVRANSPRAAVKRAGGRKQATQPTGRRSIACQPPAQTSSG